MLPQWMDDRAGEGNVHWSAWPAWFVYWITCFILGCLIGLVKVAKTKLGR